MAIRWNALQVSQGLDEMEKLLSEAEPILSQLSAKATETSHLPNLAGYISEPLATFACEVRDRLEKYRQRIKSIREHIPKGELEKQQQALQKWLNFYGDEVKAQEALKLFGLPKCKL